MKIYWSKTPGKFVNRHTGEQIDKNQTTIPEFGGGTELEWFATINEMLSELLAKDQSFGIRHIKCGNDAYQFLTSKPRLSIKKIQFGIDRTLSPCVVKYGDNQLEIVD